MEELRIIKTPLTEEVICSLSAGETVLLSGTIITARDAAHARMAELLKQGKKLPVDITGRIIY